MRSSLDLKRLRYFRAIAEHGSLSAAARALNLAQPALSHHVSELESQFGVKLLVRRHDGVTLTEAGRLLLKHATDITARVERAEAELLRFARNAGTRTRLRLAIITSLAADLTPILVAVLSRELPEVVLHIIESGSRDSRALLDQDEADVAVSLSPEGPNDHLIASEQLYYVTAQHAGARPDPISFGEVAAGPLVLPAIDNPLRAFVEAVATQARRPLDIVLEVNGSVPRLNAVLAGLGATIVGAHTVLGSDMAGLVARPIGEPALYRPVYISVRRGFDPELAARLQPLLARVLTDVGGMLVNASA